MQTYPNRISIEELHPSSPSFAEDTDANLVTLSEELSGHKCCAVNYATEAPYIQQLGCQTIVLGPGSIDQAHQPNEFLPHDEIHQTNDILNKLIIKYCL
jgi:acetylornithine deacetylase